MSATTDGSRGHPRSDTAPRRRLCRRGSRIGAPSLSPASARARLLDGLPPVAQPRRNGRLDESDRTLILILVAGALWGGCGVSSVEAQDSRATSFSRPSPLQAAPAEPPYAKAEIFGGAGVIRTDTARWIGQVGANFWMARHWGAGISHWARHGASALSIRYRLKLYDGRTALHAGASPVQFVKYPLGMEIETLPIFDVFVGRRIHRRFGVRFGLAVGAGDGAFLQPTGLAFWSFD